VWVKYEQLELMSGTFRDALDALMTEASERLACILSCWDASSSEDDSSFTRKSIDRWAKSRRRSDQFRWILTGQQSQHVHATRPTTCRWVTDLTLARKRDTDNDRPVNHWTTGDAPLSVTGARTRPNYWMYRPKYVALFIDILEVQISNLTQLPIGMRK